jgi:hypothetical protein
MFLAEFLYGIYDGWKNLILYKLEKKSHVEIAKFKAKDAICNQSCPLYNKLANIGYCDPFKDVNGVFGCGCITLAKKWGETECPMGKF